MFTKILAANDGSKNAFRAAEAAALLARKLGAELHVIFVEEVEPRNGTIEEIDQAKERGDRLLKRHTQHLDAIAAAAGVKAHAHAFIGHPVRTIVAFAKDNGFDLLVVGATGRSEFFEALIGSRAERLAREAHCPVLVVR